MTVAWLFGELTIPAEVLGIFTAILIVLLTALVSSVAYVVTMALNSKVKLAEHQVQILHLENQLASLGNEHENDMRAIQTTQSNINRAIEKIVERVEGHDRRIWLLEKHAGIDEPHVQHWPHQRIHADGDKDVTS